MLNNVPWTFVFGLGATGIIMALVSCLVGMKPRVENPAWWALYVIWILVVLLLGISAPFWTLLLASVFAGLAHGVTTSLLLGAYVKNNPWHAERTQGPRGKLAARFVLTGIGVGVVMGAVVGGVAWGLSKLPV